MIRRIWLWGAGVALTALYAFALVRPGGNLVGLPQLGLEISTTGWFWLIGAVVMPILIFALSIWLGRGKSTSVRLWILAAGLALVALLQLEMELLAPISSFFV